MSKQKRKWRTVGVLASIFERVKAMIWKTGHTSVSDYVADALRMKLRMDEARFEDE